jgi:hypothetical protein
MSAPTWPGGTTCSWRSRRPDAAPSGGCRFALLPERIGHLVELAADDAAARGSSRINLARSLLNFAAAQSPTQAPADALAASGWDTVARVERLLETPSHSGRSGIGRVLNGNAALTTPLALIAAPIVTVVVLACCQN